MFGLKISDGLLEGCIQRSTSIRYMLQSKQCFPLLTYLPSAPLGACRGPLVGHPTRSEIAFSRWEIYGLLQNLCRYEKGTCEVSWNILTLIIQTVRSNIITEVIRIEGMLNYLFGLCGILFGTQRAVSIPSTSSLCLMAMTQNNSSVFPFST